MRQYPPSQTLKFDAKADSINRQRIREADLDRIEKNKQFPTIFVKKYGFRPYFSGHDTIHMKGPLCPGTLTKERQCLAELSGDNGEATKASCDVCGRKYDMPHSFQEFRSIAHKAYDGYLNSGAELITLDIPYDAIKAESQDATRWVKVVWSQKDGRNQAIIYLINKNDNGAKTHIFADLDREEVRYDAEDIPPGKIVAKIKAEFSSSDTLITYKST